MLLIHTYQDNEDANWICETLLRKGISFDRIDTEDKIENIRCYLENGNWQVELYFKNKVIRSADYTFYWYKGGILDFSKFKSSTHQVGETAFFENELEQLAILTYKTFDNISGIGSVFKIAINKMTWLAAAEQLGIAVPNTLISSLSVDMKQLRSRNFLVKYIQDTYEIIQDGKTYLPAIKPVNELPIVQSDTIFPSCFQSAVVKDYEVRVFVLYDKCYSMKMVDLGDKSQFDIKTKKNHEVESVPFEIDNDLKHKIQQLLKRFSLVSASLDFLVKDDTYYLIDVNPIGLFKVLSDIGHYHLNEIITEKFSENTMTLATV